jgi:hypothetical protein
MAINFLGTARDFLFAIAKACFRTVKVYQMKVSSREPGYWTSTLNSLILSHVFVFSSHSHLSTTQIVLVFFVLLLYLTSSTTIQPTEDSIRTRWCSYIIKCQANPCLTGCIASQRKRPHPEWQLPVKLPRNDERLLRILPAPKWIDFLRPVYHHSPSNEANQALTRRNSQKKNPKVNRKLHRQNHIQVLGNWPIPANMIH